MKQAIKVLMAVLVALSAVSGVAVAASWDNETTTTGTQSDWSGTTNTETADWGNSSDSIYLETDGATTDNLTLELTPAESGVDYIAYENSTPDTVDSANGHYAFEVSYDELDTLPRDSSGATYNATILNDSGDVVVDTEVAFNTAADASDDAYMAVTDDAGSSGASITNVVADTTEFTADSSGMFSGLTFWSSSDDNTTDVATFSGYTEVNGSNSDVTVLLENESTQEAYSNAAADEDAGDWVEGMTMTINGVSHKVYADETPDDVNGTAVVYDTTADQLEISLGEEYEETQTVSMRSTGGDGYGFGTLWSEFSMFDALSQLVSL